MNKKPIEKGFKIFDSDSDDESCNGDEINMKAENMVQVKEFKS
jgi:hypothetical protein